MRAEVFNGGAPRPNLPPQNVVEDLTHVLLSLETHARNHVVICPSITDEENMFPLRCSFAYLIITSQKTSNTDNGDIE